MLPTWPRRLVLISGKAWSSASLRSFPTVSAPSGFAQRVTEVVQGDQHNCKTLLVKHYVGEVRVGPGSIDMI
eukprot:g33281.t1